MSTTVEKGEFGEEVAAQFLINNGYTILQRNWRYNHKEIDIIATKENWMVIVEVRLRNNILWEHPRDTITNGKIKFLTEAAEAFIFRYDIQLETRFDVICITSKNGEYNVEHIEEAFYAM